MDKDKVFKYFFVILLAITLYLTILILRPYFGFIILGMILSFSFSPIYNRLLKRVKNEMLTAIIVIALVIIILVVPSFFIVSTLVKETGSALKVLVDGQFVDIAGNFISENMNVQFDLQAALETALIDLKNYLFSLSFRIFNALSELVLGMFIAFFIMYYGMKNGDTLWEEIKALLPLHDRYKNKFFNEIKNLTYAVIYGQLITAIIQGALGGISFVIFGIPNPVFWGAIMAVLAFLPVVGTPIVWIPAVVYKLIGHDYVAAIGLLLYNAIITVNIDNLLRPRLISTKTKLHPVLILLGVLGGLSAFGFIGIVIGPIILAVLVIFLQEYTIDFKSSLVQKEESPAQEETKEKQV